MTKSNLPLTSLALLILTGCLFGCSVLHSEVAEQPRFDNTAYEQDVTHYRQVLHEHGPPTKISRLGDGMVWLYEGIDLKEKQFGFIFNNALFSLFKFSLSSGDGVYSAQYYAFDAKGMLMSMGSTVEDVSFGSGTALQLVYSMESLVNLTEMREQSLQHDWGQSLLLPIPEGLNAAQDMNSGQNGVQLLTTPAHTGQHTLATH